MIETDEDTNSTKPRDVSLSVTYVEENFNLKILSIGADREYYRNQ